MVLLSSKRLSGAGDIPFGLCGGIGQPAGNALSAGNTWQGGNQAGHLGEEAGVFPACFWGAA